MASKIQKVTALSSKQKHSNKWSQVNSQHCKGHIVPCHIMQALPLMPITKLIISFLCDCLTYKDVMDLLEDLSL